MTQAAETQESIKSQAKEWGKDISKGMDKGKEEVKKSAQEWYSYIEDHPIQSLAFGVVIFYALKGLLQK